MMPTTSGITASALPPALYGNNYNPMAFNNGYYPTAPMQGYPQFYNGQNQTVQQLSNNMGMVKIDSQVGGQCGPVRSRVGTETGSGEGV